MDIEIEGKGQVLKRTKQETKQVPPLTRISNTNQPEPHISAVQQPAASQTVQKNKPAFSQGVQQNAQMAEERKSFMSQEEYSRLETRVRGQEELLNKELRIAHREINAIYQAMMEHGFGSLSFYRIRRRISKLLAFEKFWQQRIKDPDACESLGVETPQALYQRLTDELTSSISGYLSNHQRKAGLNKRSMERIELIEKLSLHADTLKSVHGAFGRLQGELELAYSDVQGYKEGENDLAVKELAKHKRKAIKAYSSQSSFFEKDGRAYAKYQCMNGILRGDLSLDDLNEEQRAIIEDDMASLQKTLTNSALKENLLLFRGTNLLRQLGDKLMDPDALKGCILEDKGFLSTSRRESVTNGFMAADAQFDFMDMVVESTDGIPTMISLGNCRLEIQARKGAHALDIAAESDFAGEKEVLFAAGTPMYIWDARVETYRKQKLTREKIDQYNQEKGRQVIDPAMEGFEFSVCITILNVEIR